jgi:tetratricopeptide (TPR) repeat protein
MSHRCSVCIEKGIKMRPKLYRLLVTSLIVVVFLSGSALAEPTSKERLDQAERALRSGELITAEQLFRALVAEDEMNLSSRLGLAATLIKQKRLAEAAEQASIVLKYKKSATALALLGNIARSQGDFQNAVAHYRTALQIEENGLAVGGLATIDFYEKPFERESSRPSPGSSVGTKRTRLLLSSCTGHDQARALQ